MMQNLVEKILRSKIYNTMYWKEHCFALTAEALVDKAVDLRFVGGTYGGQVHSSCQISLGNYLMAPLIYELAGLRHIGTSALCRGRPTEFMCLMLKLLQLQPEKRS